jgi:hypothetical protein
MKLKRILILGVFFIFSFNVYSQTDIGYKSDCFEIYYPNIVYGNLLSIIDTNIRNTIIDNSCSFRVYLTLNIETGYLENIIIRDTCDLLSAVKEEELIPI